VLEPSIDAPGWLQRVCFKIVIEVAPCHANEVLPGWTVHFRNGKRRLAKVGLRWVGTHENVQDTKGHSINPVVGTGSRPVMQLVEVV
jgi:hypothetical protein